MTKNLLRIMAVVMTAMASAGTATADNWITPLADNIYVSNMSIPGTHDSATGEGFEGILGGLGKSMAQTQDLTISQQWDCGIRAFDLRPTVENSSDGTYLHIYHGIIKTAMTFDKALLTLRDKLKENPGEFAIVIMRHESDANSNIQDQWSALMDKYLHSEALAGYLIDFRPGLTIGDMRGKILVMSRDTYDNGPHGAYITSWSHSNEYKDQTKAVISGPDGSSERALVQDFYDCTASDGIDKKINSMLYMLNIRMAATSTRWCINHASGYTKNASSDGYRDNAVKTSEALLGVLNSSDTEPGATGIIMMDYAGTDKSGSYNVKGLELTNAIIAQNSRYTHLTTGITDNTTADSKVSVNHKTISSETPMTVYQTDGTVVAHNVTSADMPTEGIFIVKNAGESMKVMVR